MYKKQRLNKTCLLYVAYGAPTTEAEIESYYTHIRCGQRPTEAELATLKARYKAIGGSPLNAIVEAQSKALLDYVNTHIMSEVSRRSISNADNIFIEKCYVAYRFAEPYIEQVLDNIVSEGFQHIIVIANTPFSSDSTLGAYKECILTYVRKTGYNTDLTLADLNSLRIEFVDGWYLQPSFIAFWLESIEVEVKKALVAGFTKNQIYCIFSAHSLPHSIIATGDTYVEQVNALLKVLTKGLTCSPEQIHQAWQSQGPHGEWLGPDILSVIASIASNGINAESIDSTQYNRAVIISPFGFITDHLEVLYDNDIECKKACENRGLSYFRTAMPNVDTRCIAAMGEAILAKLGKDILDVN